MSAATKPACPFCGEPEASIDEIAPGQFACVCDDCGAIGPAAGLQDAAVMLWNMRAPQGVTA